MVSPMTLFNLSVDAQPSKLQQLRSLFVSDSVRNVTNGRGLDGYILHNTDAHEGSYAEILVTKNNAVLMTDGRYIEQARLQVKSDWMVVDRSLTQIIEDNMKAGSYIGFDPQLVTYEFATFTIKQLAPRKLVPVRGNLIDRIWADRPPVGKKPLIVLSDDETGKSVSDKIKGLRTWLKEKELEAIVLTAMDDIMWFFNIRGGDIEYNPLAFSYCFLTQKEVHLFIDKEKVDKKIRAHLPTVTFHEYLEAIDWLQNWQSANLKKFPNYTVFFSKSASYEIGQIFASSGKMGVSPVQKAKSIKNSVEMKGMRTSSMRDSAYIVEFLQWVEQQVSSGKKMNELELARKMTSIRLQDDKFIGDSFEAISSIGNHSAIIHYSPLNSHESERQLTKDTVLLFDSGAHYRDGTTDVTITLWYGDNAPAEFIKQHTLVLKGHIQLATTVFPKGLRGERIDALARSFLWKNGLNYAHGTGLELIHATIILELIHATMLSFG